MTKEELEQKAINRIKETTPVLKDRSDIEIIAICHVRVEDYIAGATEATKELEAQIEKMKCCENCGWYYLQQHWRESKEINESRMFHCGTCGNKKNWKLREIKAK